MNELQEESDRCPMAKGTKKTESNANLGFEAKLWLSADKLCNNMDAAEHKIGRAHV